MSPAVTRPHSLPRSSLHPRPPELSVTLDRGHSVEKEANLLFYSSMENFFCSLSWIAEAADKPLDCRQLLEFTRSKSHIKYVFILTSGKVSKQYRNFVSELANQKLYTTEIVLQSCFLYWPPWIRLKSILAHLEYSRAVANVLLLAQIQVNLWWQYPSSRPTKVGFGA